MELTYTKHGDYFIPNLSLPDMSGYIIGKYGRMCKRYLKEHHRGIFEGMILSGELGRILLRLTKPVMNAWSGLSRQWQKPKA